MTQKTILITGATSGIGLAGAEELGRRGWRVLVHGRSEARAQSAIDSLLARVPPGRFEGVTGDLSSLTSVAALAAQVAARASILDVLWNNAGAVAETRRASADGIELQMAVNHLAPFALTTLLLDQLKAAPQGRMIATTTGSMAQFFVPSQVERWLDAPAGNYSAFAVYVKSKLANVLFTQELARRLAGSAVTAHCFHPGLVQTAFGSPRESGRKPSLMVSLAGLVSLPPAKGADTGVFLAEAREAAGTTGLYWVKRRVKAPSKLATPQSAVQLWEESEAAVRRVLGERAPSIGAMAAAI